MPGLWYFDMAAWSGFVGALLHALVESGERCRLSVGAEMQCIREIYARFEHIQCFRYRGGDGVYKHSVMPAQAGIQNRPIGRFFFKPWIPACAGMTA